MGGRLDPKSQLALPDISAEEELERFLIDI